MIDWQTMNKIIRFVIVTMILSATGGLVSIDVPAAEDCTDEDEISVMGWQNWQKLTIKPIVSEGHESWVNIYVNALADEIYRNVGSQFPVCAKVVKVSYKDEEGKLFDGVTAMVKMPSGYDPENGDWWYAMYDEMNSKATKQGRLIVDCVSCHKQALKTDYLFSKEVMSAIVSE